MPVRHAAVARSAIALAVAVALAAAVITAVVAATGALPGTGGDSQPSVRIQPTPTRARPTPRPPSPTPVPPTTTPSPLPPPPPEESVGIPPPASDASPEPPPVASHQEPPPPEERQWRDAGFSAQVLALVNGERASRGLPELGTDGALQSAAENYARELTYAHTLSHDLSGDLQSRVIAAGYPGNAWLGEVLWMATATASPEMAVPGWLNSPAHHDIILGDVYSEAGVACEIWTSGSARETRCDLIVAG